MERLTKIRRELELWLDIVNTICECGICGESKAEYLIGRIHALLQNKKLWKE